MSPAGARGYRAAILSAGGDGASIAYHEDAVLVVDERGRVAAIAAPDGVAAAAPFVHDLRGHLLVPGFVDAHVHYPQTRALGTANGPLLEWLDKIVFPEEAKFDGGAYAREVAGEFVVAAASRGTTTVGAYSSSSEGATRVLFEALHEAGMRAVVGYVMMDQSCPEALRVPADRAIAACRDLASEWHGGAGGRLRLAVTPRFAIACSRALLEGAAKLARDLDLAVMTHVSENPVEARETLLAHPFAADYLGVYEATGLVHEHTLLAHAIHLSPSEWDRVARAGAKIAHCPDSNFFLGSGAMRIEEARARGIPVGLGTDVAAGRSFDVRRTVGYAYDAAHVTGSKTSQEELFTLATLGGARALGMDGEIGTLEPGKQADFAVLRVPAYSRGRDEALRLATFATDLAPVVRTYVAGRLVWSGHLTPLA